MKIIFLGLALLFCSFSQALVQVSGSAEQRYEIDMDQNRNFQSYWVLTGEYHWNHFYVGLEYFRGSSEESGQQTLALSRYRRGAWATLSWHAFERKFLELFYLRAGLGGFQDDVKTTFFGTTTRDLSRVYPSGFGGIGMNIKLIPSLFSAVEWKVIFAENQDRSGVMGILVRLGWEF